MPAYEHLLSVICADILFEPDFGSAGCDIGRCVLFRDEPIFFFPNETLKGKIITTEGRFSIDIIGAERGVVASQTLS